MWLTILFINLSLFAAINGKPELTEADCLKIENQCDREECLIDLVYQSAIYPTSSLIVSGQQKAPAFSENVIGRITPIGIFEDLEASIEYFYALANDPNVIFPGALIFEGHTITSSICQNNLIYVRVDLLFKPIVTIPGTPCHTDGGNITHVGEWKFNNQGTQIIAYDITAPQLQQAITYIYSENCNGVGNDMSVSPETMIQLICQVEAAYCLNEYDEYDSFAACQTFLQSIEVGDFNDLTGDNTVNCRRLHSLLVPLRPDVHCNHIGPSSTKCHPITYNEWYEFSIEGISSDDTSDSDDVMNALSDAINPGYTSQPHDIDIYNYKIIFDITDATTRNMCALYGGIAVVLVVNVLFCRRLFDRNLFDRNSKQVISDEYV